MKMKCWMEFRIEMPSISKFSLKIPYKDTELKLKHCSASEGANDIFCYKDKIALHCIVLRWIDFTGKIFRVNKKSST